MIERFERSGGEGKNVRRSNRRRKRGGEANEIDAFIPVTVSTSRYNFIETKLSPVDIQFPGGERASLRSAVGTIPLCAWTGQTMEGEER